MSQSNSKGTTCASSEELQKMVKSLRVTDLQTLLGYAGRSRNGKKYELQHRALELVKLNSATVAMKVRELHMSRYQQSQRLPVPDPQDLYPAGTMNDSLSGGNPYRSTLAHQAPLGTVNPGYVQQLGKPVLRNMNPLNIIPPYAVNPDVKFKELPFYDLLCEIMRPTSLISGINEISPIRELTFYLTPQQLMQIEQNADVQVQLRFCLLETSCEQDDEFPPDINLLVNGRPANLPPPLPTNKIGQRILPKRPVNITNVTKLTPVEENKISVKWALSSGRPYVAAVFLVKKQSSSVLITRLKANGVRNPDHTTAMIKEKLCQDRDSEIATMSLRGSLICPLGKIKMMLPCRALTCTHLQCFDATLYVQMNEKKPKWICPVCDKPALFKSLAIDGLFLDIVSKAPFECTEVQFHEDGSWMPVMPVKKTAKISEKFEVTPKESAPKPKKPTVEVISLDSDSETEESWPVLPPKKKLCNLPVGIISPSVNHTSHESTQLVNAAVSKLLDPVDLPAPKADTPVNDSALPSINDSLPESFNIESIVSGINITPTTSSDKAPVSPSYIPLSSEPFNVSCSNPTELLDTVPHFNYYSLIDDPEDFNIPPSLEGVPDVISLDDD